MSKKTFKQNKFNDIFDKEDEISITENNAYKILSTLAYYEDSYPCKYLNINSKEEILTAIKLLCYDIDKIHSLNRGESAISILSNIKTNKIPTQFDLF